MRRYVALLFVCLAVACGPGNYARRAPASGPTPVPTPTPTPSIFTFLGSILSTQNGTPVAGATIAIGSQTTQSQADGTFSVEVGSDASEVTVSAPGFLTRQTRLAGGQDRSGARIDLISTEGPFNLDFFDRLARSKEQPFNQHLNPWPTNPHFYIITKVTTQQGGNPVSTDEDVPQEVLDRIAAAVPQLVSEATGGRRQVGSIQFRPDARATWETGFVQIDVARRPAGTASDLCGNGGTTVVFAGGDPRNETSRVGFASYYLEDNCRCGTQVPANLIITHEIGHAMGYHHTMPYTTSVMSYLADPALLPCARTGFSDLDRYHASLAYARSIGNVSPDTDPTSFQFQRAGGRRSTENRFSCPLPGGGF